MGDYRMKQMSKEIVNDNNICINNNNINNMSSSVGSEINLIPANVKDEISSATPTTSVQQQQQCKDNNYSINVISIDDSQNKNSNSNNNNNNNNTNNFKQEFHNTIGYFNMSNSEFFKKVLNRKNRLIFYIFDWIFCIGVGLIGAIIFQYVPARGRLFSLNDLSISYPLVEEIVPFTHLIVYSTIIPICLISAINLVFTRNLTDFHHGILGLLQSIALSLLLVSCFKSFIGGLRPNFLEVCNPSQELINKFKPLGYGGQYYSSDICTGTDKAVNDGLSAYPSGHAAIAAAGLTFLGLYLNAKLKTFKNRGHLLIYAVVLMCIVSFLLIGITRIADYRHTVGNVICGWILGVVIAFSMYKLNFMSLLGKDNHIPIAFSYEN